MHQNVLIKLIKNLLFLFTVKKLTRGISRATDNVKLVSRARSDIALDFGENAVCNVNQYFIETPVFTFTLPDLTVYPGIHWMFLFITVEIHLK